MYKNEPKTLKKKKNNIKRKAKRKTHSDVPPVQPLQMALNSLSRRASSTLLPLAIRAAGSPRTIHRAVSAALCVEKRCLGHDLGSQGYFLSSRFSTAAAEKPSADYSLIRVLESEIECAVKPNDVEDVPDGFPFEIQDNPGERTILLKRKYLDEIIKVEVDMPNTGTEEDGHDEAEDEDNESNVPPSLPMVVSISKGNGQCLEFGITAFADEITIDSLSIKSPESSEDQLSYEGPDFNDLDENLQKHFHKYLEIRGITPSASNFLLEYMNNKDNREYLQWLKNLKNFVEK
uniref:Mitochondrial glycoprotein family protein n=1 Tax=Rhizophora mucronata TaxID=61149 RepID=A0A2P2KF38_RHIMU